jgi:hypothetical protein
MRRRSDRKERLLRRNNNDAAPKAASERILPDRTLQSSVGGGETRYPRRLIRG